VCVCVCKLYIYFEVVGHEYSCIMDIDPQLVRMSVFLCTEDLVQVVKVLHSWQNGKGISVNPFVDGFIPVCYFIMNQENES
jgi:hypothetical protein